MVPAVATGGEDDRQNGSAILEKNYLKLLHGVS